MDHHTSTFTQGLNMPVLTIIAVVGTLVVWVSVVGTQAYYETQLRAEEQKKIIDQSYIRSATVVIDDQPVKVAELLARQQMNLAHLDEARRQVIARYGRKAPAAEASPQHASDGS